MDITSLPREKYHAQIYSNAEEDAQIALVTTYPEFFSISTEELLDKIEAVVTRKANPMVHRVAFASKVCVRATAKPYNSMSFDCCCFVYLA